MTDTVDERRLFADFLRRRGLKTTRERTALFDEIFATHHHFDADDLVVRLRGKGKKVSRATVYRTLDLLYDCGLVSRVRLNDEKYRYERLLRRRAPRPPHLHLLRRRRRVRRPRIEELQDAVCRKYDFRRRRTRTRSAASARSARRAQAKARGAAPA